MQVSTSPVSNPSPFSIRLWNPEDSVDPREEMGKLTLRQAYEMYYKPSLVLENAAPATFKEYERAIGHWERLMPSNPTLANIDDFVMQQFRGLVDMATGTCNKWFRHIRAILNKMGPRIASDKRSRGNLRYFAEVPLLEDLELSRQELIKVRPLQVRAATINALYKFADVATWPTESRTGVAPPVWWRAVFVFTVNYGPRRSDWYWMKRTAIDMVTGRIEFIAKKTGKLHQWVFNDTVAAHLDPFPRDEREFFFSPTKAHKQLYNQFHLIQQAAQVVGKDGEPLTFHDLRRCAGQRIHKHSPGTASLLLGHKLPDAREMVTMDSYVGDAMLHPLWQAQRTIPQPEAFRKVTADWLDAHRTESKPGRQRYDPHQMQLFDQLDV